MSDLFQTGANALSAFRRAINTTSHNIANLNTEGFSRQRVLLGTRPPLETPVGAIGNGVQVIGIERINSEFATSRLFDATANHARDQAHHELASRIDDLVASDALSMAPALDTFFSSLEDASTDPGASATRQALVSGASALADRFRALDAQLDDTASELDDRRRASVDTINELASSLAGINRDISTQSGGTARQVASADLLDERERLVQKLTEQTDVQVIEQKDGSLNISIGNGMALVTGRRVNRLSVETGERPGRSRVMIEDRSGTVLVGGQLTGGTLGGLESFAVQTLTPVTHRLGQMAQVFAARMNQAHTAGIDLRGARGAQWFSTGEPNVMGASTNSATPAPTVTIDDAGALLPADYEMRFDGALWQITRSNDGFKTSAGSPFTLDGLTFDMPAAAAGDRFTISATGTAAGNLNALLSDPKALALASPIRGDTPLGNTGNTRVDRLTSTDPTDAALTDEVVLTFTAPNSYDLVNATSGATIAAGVPWQSGDTISANGWTLTLDGTPAAGDRHRVVPNLDGGSDNRNALDMVRLRRDATVEGRDSFDEAFGGLVGEIGTRTRSLATRAQTLGALKSEAQLQRDAVSGVDLDEEALNLTRNEQAYQAAAQVITVADDLFQTILGVVR